MSIVALRWFRILEDHTRCHRVCALNIGVIEALYVARQLRKTEIALHGGEGAHHTLLRIEFLSVLQFIEHELLGVA